jgi:transposase
MRSTETISSVAPIQRRRRFSNGFKRQVVEETFVRGASIAGIALRYRLNANQVFNWRRKYLRESALASAKAAKMLPVTIEAASAPLPVQRSSQSSVRRSGARALPRGSIEIEYAGATIRVRGIVDPDALRVALEVLAAR